MTEQNPQNEVPVQDEVIAETVPQPKPKRELTDEEKVKLEQQKKAFVEFKRGGLFLKYIMKDIERQKNQHYNRTQRRRFEKELKNGIISKELFDVYLSQVDVAIEWIEGQLNPKPKQTPVDGVIEQTGAVISPIGGVSETKTEV